MTETPARAAILHEAADLIDGDRNVTYGTPTQNFSTIAALWNVQFDDLLAPGKVFEAHHVAEAQIHVKMARNITDRKKDNWLDIAGYAGCGYETTLPPEPVAVTPTKSEVSDVETFVINLFPVSQTMDADSLAKKIAYKITSMRG